MTRRIESASLNVIVTMYFFIGLFFLTASTTSPRLAELRRRRLGPRLSSTRSIRRSHEERTPHGRGLPLSQRLHTNGKYSNANENII